MKFIRCLIACVLIAIAAPGYTQTTTAQKVIVKERLILTGDTLTDVIKSISNAATHYQTPTGKAVYDWVTGTFLQTVAKTTRFSGSGTTGSPLELAQQGASSGQILKWNGTSWAPAADATGTTLSADSLMRAVGLYTASSGTLPTFTPNANYGPFWAKNTTDGVFYRYDRSTSAWVVDTYALTGAITKTSGSTVTTLASNQVDSTHVKPRSIAGGDIALATIAGANMQLNSLDSTHVKPRSLAGSDIRLATIAGVNIQSATIDSNNIKPLSIPNSDLAGGITLSKLGQSAAATGQVIKWNGSGWVPSADLGGWGLTGNTATAGSDFLGTTNLVSLAFRTNNLQRMKIDSLGNVGIGVNLPLARMYVVGAGSTSSTWTAQFHNLTGSNNALRIRDDGAVFVPGGITVGASNSINGLFMGDATSGQESIILRSSVFPSTTGLSDIVFGNGQGSPTITSGVRNLVGISTGFAPTSGTGELRWFNVSPNVNQTGGASGASIGFLANPILTNAASWRSFEYRNNSGWGIYGVGTANNYLNGWLGLGTTTMSADRFDIQGTAVSDGPATSGELATTATGTGWTGTSFATGYQDTGGAGTGPLTANSLTIVSGAFYQVNFTVTGRTAGSFVATLGGITSAAFIATGQFPQQQTTSTATLVITPTADFDGTVVVSVRRITAATPLIAYKSSSGGITLTVQSNTTSNTIIGNNSGHFSSVSGGTGIKKTLFGSNAGNLVTTATNVSSFGANSGFTNTTGTFWSAFGADAGLSNRTGSHWTAIGASAGQAALGTDWTAIGSYSAYQNTSTTARWVAMGRFAAGSNISGQDFVALGYISGGTGSNYAAVGYQAARYSDANGYVSIGGNSALNHISGNQFVAIGIDAGSYTNALGNSQYFANSVYIGAGARSTNGTSGSPTSNEVVIGGLNAQSLGTNTTVIGTSATTQTWLGGSLTLGTTGAPAARLHVQIGTATEIGLIVRGAAGQTANLAQFQNSAGTALTSITSNGSIVLSNSTDLNWNTFSKISSAANGNLTLYNNSYNGFGILQFGGTGPTMPGLKRFANNTLQVISSDDATASNLLVTGSLAVGATSAAAKVHIVGTGATSATWSLQVHNNATNNALMVRDDGRTGLGTATLAAATLTIAAGTTSTAPLNIPAGTNTTTIAAGNIENNGTDLQYSPDAFSRYVLIKGYSGTSPSLDFPAMAQGTGAVLTFTDSNAASGDIITISNPFASGGSFTFTAGCSTSGTIWVNVISWGSGTNDPGAATFKYRILK